MSRSVAAGWFVGVAAVALLGACAGQVPQETLADKISPVERGRYLVTVAGCHDCHTPKVFTERGPVPDMARALSGHPADAGLPEIATEALGPGRWFLFNEHLTAAVGPWGVSFAANLTPDPETGIGSWPQQMFIDTLRNGKHLGSGRPLLPPMPWMNLVTATQQDLEAIYAYLQSLEPIRNQVPEPIPPGGSEPAGD
jgi:hypothetical protein